MESLSEETWDVVICGTGLQQSLLALALSRSDKKILHIDPNDYYGGPEAAFSLQEAEEWASKFASPDQGSSIFRSAAISRPSEPPAGGLSFPRAYSLSLSPQLIHSNSALLSQLVSSRAFRQLEFLAVGSFFILKPGSPDKPPALVRIPSTREDVFSSTELPARAKRSLMKFLKLVLAQQEDGDLQVQQQQQWQDYADRTLADFLREKMGLDAEVQAYITTLTLSLDGNISTKDGIAAISRHLRSMGMFGPGFAAVYPKFGGGSEIAQVACRAGAVGGAIYMLGTGIKELRPAAEGAEEIELELTNGVSVKTRMLVRGAEEESEPDAGQRVSRLIAVVGSPLPSLFESTMEGAPTPGAAVIALPPGSVEGEGGVPSKYPIHVIAHSSDAGECPTGQSVLYLSTLYTPEAKSLLDAGLSAFLASLGTDQTPPCLYQLYYEQAAGRSEPRIDGSIFQMPRPSVNLAFDDSTLEPVRKAWQMAFGAAAEEADAEYMVFTDREGVGDDDDVYE
ncbi:Rab proteins geranylgeranyltransferase [Pleurostoma richardsiae]|uniref:Rab proteins geranylgeranyltransferase n=1 Tax=Pleurostoma richardsiae TaxID=41990 RepID=A0AA38S3H3_9PEZI|nr:Rab proteins geranylgeranyltransferase [Pleurostoma richardsiae]